MVALQFLGTLVTGVDAYDHSLSDLDILAGPGGPILAAVNRTDGGLVTFTIGPTGTALADMTNIAGSNQVGARPRLVGLDDETFLITGANGINVTRVTLNASGEIWQMATQGGISGALRASDAVLLSATTLVMAGPSQSQATAYQVSASGTLGGATSLSDTPTTHASAIGALATGQGAAAQVLLVGSQAEYGVSAYLLEDGHLEPASRIGPQDGLGLMVPTGIATLEIDGQSFAIVASSPGATGEAGALSVLAVGADGTLTPTDHLLDTRDSRFGRAQSVSAIEIDGRGFVVAGGGDQGLSLLTLTPQGQLIHLQSIADTASMGLSGAIDIELVVQGTRLEIFVITETDAGIAHFLVDIGTLGETLQALDTGETLQGGAGDDLILGGAGRDNLAGGAGDDVLVDGAEDDRLTGNAGADLFVFVQDGSRDRITDFDPSMDRIDLSSWAFLHDTTQLVIEIRGGHTRITHRDERIDVSTQSGTPIDPEDLRAAIVLDVNRAFLPPALEQTGTAGADSLDGSWGPDTLSGGAGDDEIEGFQGDDMLDGGAGIDTLILNTQSGDVQIFDLGGGAFEIHSSQGIDIAEGFEVYAFRNETLSQSQMQARALPDPGRIGSVLQGTTSDDVLDGKRFNDTMFGQEGDDLLYGLSGNDVMMGGAGNDTLSGSAGDDTMSGGTGDDVFVMRPGTSGDVFVYATGSDRVLDFDPDRDIMRFTQDVHGSYVSPQDMIDEVASVTGLGVVFDLPGEDRLVLSNLTDLTGLAQALQFE